jgi:hypothetical protein
LRNKSPGRPQLAETAKAMPCHWPLLEKTASQQVSCFAKASAKLHFALGFFRLKTRAGFVGFVARACHSLDSGPSGASTFPRIWIRSIGACKNSVKRKTQYLVRKFPVCLHLVVDFPRAAPCRFVFSINFFASLAKFPFTIFF